MIDVAVEDLLDMNEARRERVFRNRLTNQPASLGKIYRLAQHGTRAVNGERVRLEVVKTPGGFCTSKQAIQRFIEKLSAPAAFPSAPSRARRERSCRAEEELVAAGFEIGG